MPTGKLALIVGVNAYSSEPLDFCVNDARDLSTVVQAPEYSFATRLLLDEQVTRRQLLEELEIARLANPELFLFYFAGHGCTTDVGTFLVTFDGSPLDEGLELSHLARILNRFVAQGTKTVLVLDCCHSGSATPWPGRTNAIRRDDIEQAVPAFGFSRVILAACRPDEVAKEDEGIGHGLFTHHLLEGLLGEAADREGNVTAHSIFDYLCKTFETQVHQKPVFRADLDGRLILGRGFPPRTGMVLEAEAAEQAEAEAKQFLDEYARRTAATFEAWRKSGYHSACQALEPVLRWFNGKLAQYPDLSRRPLFTDLQRSALRRLAELAHVDRGTFVGEGTVDQKLGEGAFGAVWKVSYPNSPALAFKVYNPSELELSEKILRFERGYRAMKQLNHPRIVKVHSYTSVPVGFFMDFIDGPNLRSLGQAFADPAEVLEVLLSVADTIRHAHDRGIIHRDIKPENIIMRFEGGKWVPFLTDFDLAWFSTATKITRDAMGTVFYAAPEQLARPNSRAAHSPAVDVFSFAQLAFFAFSGRDPVPLGTADNERALSERVNSFLSGSAAVQILKFYKECTSHGPEARPPLTEVVERITSALATLRTVKLGARLSPEELIKEAIFLMIGLGQQETGGTGAEFVSLAGRTKVEISTSATSEDSKATLNCRLTPTQGLFLPGVSNEEARALLNARVNDALSHFPRARRRSGSQGTYEVFIYIENVPLAYEGVELCRQVISRVVGAIERL